jgi:hypothetical protein
VLNLEGAEELRHAILDLSGGVTKGVIHKTRPMTDLILSVKLKFVNQSVDEIGL